MNVKVIKTLMSCTAGIWVGALLLGCPQLVAQQGAPGSAQTAAAASTAGPVLPDAQVEANVLKALAAVPELADQSVSTTTVYGVVTLTGAVHDEGSRGLAERTVAITAGVKKVVDELTIGVPSGAAAGGAMQDQSGAEEAGGGNQTESNSALQSDGTMTPGQPEAPGQPGTPGPPSEYGSGGGGRSATGPTPPGAGGQENPDGAWTGDRPLPSDRQGPSYGNGRRNPYRSAPPQGYSDGQQNQQPRGPQQAGLQVVVAEGSLLRVRIDEGMDSEHAQVGAIFNGIVLNNVFSNGNVAIPRGASVLGRVVDAQGSGALRGRGELALELTQLTLDGQVYPLATDAWTRAGMNKTGATVGNTVGMGLTGALVGAVAGGGPGALLGAGLGGAAGLGASAAFGGGKVFLPAEAILTFHLAQQVTVTTVGQAELDGLAAGVPQVAPPEGRTRLRPIHYRLLRVPQAEGD